MTKSHVARPPDHLPASLFLSHSGRQYAVYFPGRAFNDSHAMPERCAAAGRVAVAMKIDTYQTIGGAGPAVSLLEQGLGLERQFSLRLRSGA